MLLLLNAGYRNIFSQKPMGSTRGVELFNCLIIASCYREFI
ncbi:hypothetical protein D1AOALGA4SA_2323 [Olavius algarvensis Delta 1 endosymbiont]|nr:hypothetical protein D1AOALGA4SA_2323 [Olavius algarvensis Delta 1 endosymbiont]